MSKWPYDLAIVDVDNILYDFSVPLYNKLKWINPNIPSPHHWFEWDFAFNYINKKQFYTAVDYVHRMQSVYAPFKEAKELLYFLTGNCKEVIIASHRKTRRLKELKVWLDFWGLMYTSINISQDKTKLFTPTSIVIDDSPEILQYCYLNDIAHLGLDYPWNRRRIGQQFLKDTLRDLIDSLRTMA